MEKLAFEDYLALEEDLETATSLESNNIPGCKACTGPNFSNYKVKVDMGSEGAVFCQDFIT